VGATFIPQNFEIMKKTIKKIRDFGLVLFGMAILLSSCKAFQPVQVGPFVGYENANSSTEIIDPVCGQIIETPQKDLIWQVEGRNYYFSSNECLESFKMTPEKYILPQPAENQRTTNNNVVTWGLWGAAAGTMTLIMLL